MKEQAQGKYAPCLVTYIREVVPPGLDFWSFYSNSVLSPLRQASMTVGIHQSQLTAGCGGHSLEYRFQGSIQASQSKCSEIGFDGFS